MGFFSAVKKIFSSKEQKNTQLDEEQGLAETQETIETQEIPKIEEGIFRAENIQESPKEDISLLSELESYKIEQADQAEQIEEALVQAPLQKQEAIQVQASAQKQVAPKTSPLGEEFDALALALRSTDAKLSSWLVVTLENIDEADALFWKRLSYLLKALETPQEEADEFCREFKAWLERMDYYYLNDFRSELQYRLALALELEDEEDERDLLFLKIQKGLERTRNQLGKGLQNLFAEHGKLGDAFFEELEELFIMSDMGTELSLKLVGQLREHARVNKLEEAKELLPYLEEEVGKLFRTPKRISAINSPEVVLVIGVNGVGKTTTIAKLAYRAKMQGKKVLITGADTFRAAAVEQLETWAIRVGADFYSKGSGADPAAVAYEAMDKALAGNYDIVFIDTAGRLHNKSNLMDELQKIRNVIAKKHSGAPHRSILVIDATTGQNALQQTKVFKESSGVDEIILTKLDGTAKGGVALSVASMFEIPITFVGLGEKMEDLRPFHSDDFAKALFGERED